MARGGEELAVLNKIASLLEQIAKQGGGGGAGGTAAGQAASAGSGGVGAGLLGKLGAVGLAGGALATGQAAQRLAGAAVDSAIASGGDPDAISGGFLREGLSLAGSVPVVGGLAKQITEPFDRAQASVSARAENLARIGSPLDREQIDGIRDLALGAEDRAQAARRAVSASFDEKFSGAATREAIPALAELGLAAAKVKQELTELYPVVNAIRVSLGFR